MNDEEIKQAALEFARLQPVQWDAFLAKWETDHSVATESVTLNLEVAVPELVASPEPTVEVEEAATVEVEETKPEVETPVVQPRKVASRKTKAAAS